MHDKHLCWPPTFFLTPQCPLPTLFKFYIRHCLQAMYSKSVNVVKIKAETFNVLKPSTEKLTNTV